MASQVAETAAMVKYEKKRNDHDSRPGPRGDDGAEIRRQNEDRGPSRAPRGWAYPRTASSERKAPHVSAGEGAKQTEANEHACVNAQKGQTVWQAGGTGSNERASGGMGKTGRSINSESSGTNHFDAQYESKKQLTTTQ